MNLTALTWASTAAVLAHNAEEAWLLPRWSQRAGRWYRPVGRAQFGFAVAVLSIMFVALAVASAVLGRQSPTVQTLFAGYVAAMVANAVVPHLALSLASRRYMPGTASGCLLVVPTGALYLWAAIQQQQVEVGTLLWAAPLVAVGLVACIPLLLRVGRLLWPEALPEAAPAPACEVAPALHTTLKPKTRVSWHLALLMTLTAVAIQLATSYAASLVSEGIGTPFATLGAWGAHHTPLLSVGLGNLLHHVHWLQVVALQMLILVPGVAAIKGVRRLSCFPVGVLPGVIANGVEALGFGAVRNWFVVSAGDAGPWAFSAGDLWVLAALLHGLVAAALRMGRIQR